MENWGMDKLKNGWMKCRIKNDKWWIEWKNWGIDKLKNGWMKCRMVNDEW